MKVKHILSGNYFVPKFVVWLGLLNTRQVCVETTKIITLNLILSFVGALPYIYRIRVKEGKAPNQKSRGFYSRELS